MATVRSLRGPFPKALLAAVAVDSVDAGHSAMATAGTGYFFVLRRPVTRTAGGLPL
jgi:hypothetical protein